MSSAAYSADIDFKHCVGAVNSLADLTSDFMKMDSNGELKILRNSSSMKTEGDSIIYSDFKLNLSSEKNKNGTKLVKATGLSDVEIFKVRYEKVEDGKPVGKIIGVDYSVKDKQDTHGEELSMSFNYRNGHCVPETTKKSIFGQKGKAGQFMIKSLAKALPSTRAWDLQKCKRLYDYIEKNKGLEACLTSSQELEQLASVMQYLVNPDNNSKNTANKIVKSMEKTQKNIDKAFQIYKDAKVYMDGCEESGYKDILSDKEYWQAIDKDKDDNSAIAIARERKTGTLSK